MGISALALPSTSSCLSRIAKSRDTIFDFSIFVLHACRTKLLSPHLNAPSASSSLDSQCNDQEQTSHRHSQFLSLITMWSLKRIKVWAQRWISVLILRASHTDRKGWKCFPQINFHLVYIFLYISVAYSVYSPWGTYGYHLAWDMMWVSLGMLLLIATLLLL